MESEQTKYAIIGTGAAGMAAAEAIRKHDRDGTITVVTEEPDMPYFRPMIPFLISGKKTGGDIALAGHGPYQSENIDIRTDCRVAGIDVVKKELATADNRTIRFDKLLIASGSAPYIPSDIHGTRTRGVYAMRTLAHARDMAGQVSETRHAAMLGGGLLNLKTAFALLERGVRVTLVVKSPQVLSQLMESDDAALIREALQAAGLEIMTGCAATRILAENGRATGVLLDNGREIPCQMICIGKGVRPGVAFLKESGIHMDGGVVVDRHTRTNCPDIHAAGDVAATFDPVTGGRIVTGLWTNAVEMGLCAGSNMAGAATEYAGTFGILNATQVANMPFVSMGIVHTSGGDFEVHTESGKDFHRKAVFSHDGKTLAGVVFIGNITNAGLYRLLIREKRDIHSIKHHIINHTLHYGHLLKLQGNGRAVAQL